MLASVDVVDDVSPYETRLLCTLPVLTVLLRHARATHVTYYIHTITYIFSHQILVAYTRKGTGTHTNDEKNKTLLAVNSDLYGPYVRLVAHCLSKFLNCLTCKLVLIACRHVKVNL